MHPILFPADLYTEILKHVCLKINNHVTAKDHIFSV